MIGPICCRNCYELFSPLNPALFWAERHLCLEREQACDDAVLDAAGNARAYATCLTKLGREPGWLSGPRCWRRACGSGIPNWRAEWRTSSIAGATWAPCFLVAWSRLGSWLLSPACSCCSAAPASLLLPAMTRLLQRFLRWNRLIAEQPQARYQEAVFHPDMSRPAERASVLPKPHSPRPVRTFRRLQFVQVAEDQDGGGITLVLFTVEVPQSSSGSHGEPRTTLPSPDHWIAFQI